MQFLNVILNLLFMQRLSTEQLGVLSLAKVFLQSADYSHLGTRFSLDRFVPTSEKERSINYAIIASLVSLLVSLLITCYILYSQGETLIYLSFFISGVIIAQSNILKAYYRGRGNTVVMIAVPFYFSILPILAILLFIWIDFNYEYLVLYFIPYLVFGLMFSIKYIKKTFLWLYNGCFNLEGSEQFFSVSKVLLINAVCVFLYSALDRVFISNFLGEKILGEYSVVIFAFSALLVLPSIIAELIYPKIVRETIETGRVIYIKETLFILLPTVIAVILVNFSMGFFIVKYTQYEYLLSEIHLVTWGVLPFCFTAILYHVLNALDLRKYIVLSNGIVLMFLIVSLVAFNLFDVYEMYYFVLLKISLGIVLLLAYLISLVFSDFKTGAVSD